MKAKRLNPILNVSNIVETFAWFERLGWKKGWDWGDPPTFGAVISGECEIFLCEDGRGKGDAKATFGPDSDQSADKGVWISIWVVKARWLPYARCPLRTGQSDLTSSTEPGTHKSRHGYARKGPKITEMFTHSQARKPEQWFAELS